MAELVESTLAEFLRAYGDKPWQPDAVNCCLFLASWALWLGHSDPAQHLRGAFHTEKEFRALVDAAGSVAAVVGPCAVSIGWRPTLEPPRCGDVGVIGTPLHTHRQFGAIYDGERWLIRFIDRVGPMRARPLAIWSI